MFVKKIQEYLKTTKINFNLIKYFFIELSNLDNKETEIVESISNFCKLYLNTRVIILAQGFNEQSEILNKLYEIGIYNIINSTEEAELEKEILKALSEDGIQKKEAKRFKKLEEVKEQKSNKLSKIKKVIQKKNKKEKKSKQINDTLPKEIEGVQVIHQSGGVYFFAILLEAMTRLVKLICYIAIFLLDLQF